MNSLLHYEGLGGQVQMIYLDPPYGIKFGSNFQPFVRKRDVKHNDDEDMTREPEMVKAYRDTWEMGLHSYLTYMRDRLLLCLELLAPSGSIFIQIGDENVHHVRELLDQIFGGENFVSLITVKKTAAQTDKYISSSCDYIIWYGKDISKMKYRQLFLGKEEGSSLSIQYRYAELPDGRIKRLNKMTHEELLLPYRLFRPDNLTSSHEYSEGKTPVEFEGKFYTPGPRYWSTSPKGFEELKKNNRLIAVGNTLSYVRYLDDFPCAPLLNIWIDTGTGGYGDERYYVVQTTSKVVERCLLMTTTPVIWCWTPPAAVAPRLTWQRSGGDAGSPMT
jgi:adenine-specific DNA-methyltransferase